MRSSTISLAGSRPGDDVGRVNPGGIRRAVIVEASAAYAAANVFVRRA
jgi:hypothetical protein